MKTLALALLLAAFAIAPALGAQLSLNMGPSHFGQEMEFYYAKPRAAMLPEMLKSFANAGVLDNAEKRMFVAAFLAALKQKNGVDLDALARKTQQPAALRTIAWAAHLADEKLGLKELGQILKPEDAPLAAQIIHSPTPLAAWEPNWEKSSLNMNWAAFMATGDNFWLDRVIDCAVGYAHSNKGAAACAASLYDYAPRHSAAAARIKEVQGKYRTVEREVLQTILDHAGEGQPVF